MVEQEKPAVKRGKGKEVLTQNARPWVIVHTVGKQRAAKGGEAVQFCKGL